METDKIIQYIHNQLNRGPDLLESMIKDESGKKYIKRQVCYKIEAYINDFLQGKKDIRLLGIPGLRGVGKTTLLAQIFMDFLPLHRNSMLYISADQVVTLLNSNLYTLFEEYQKILGVSFEQLHKNIFLFLDEIHFDENWAAVLKSLYDKTKNIFVLFTGSSALSLQTNADIARRVIFEKLYPLTYKERLLLLNKNQTSPIKSVDEKNELHTILFYRETAEDIFNTLKSFSYELHSQANYIDAFEIDKYLKFGTMPFLITIEDENKCYLLMNSLIDRVIEKDLLEAGMLDIDTIEKAKNILLLIASSDELSLTSLAQNLTNISITTLSNLFYAMEKAELIIRIYPYGGVFKKVKKPSKYFFMTPAIRHTLLSSVEGMIAYTKYKGKYLEDIVALFLYKKFGDNKMCPIFYDSAQGGADFIIQLGQKKIVIEVGFGNKGINQIEFTLKKINGTYGILISPNELEYIREKNIIKIPINYFLMM